MNQLSRFRERHRQEHYIILGVAMQLPPQQEQQVIRVIRVGQNRIYIRRT